jgi:voltage-dependent anion channel protein 2
LAVPSLFFETCESISVSRAHRDTNKGNSSFLYCSPRLAPRLLNDDYIYDKKVQVKTKTVNGLTYTTTGIQSGYDDALAGDLSLKYSLVPGAEVTSKFFTSGKMTHEAVLDRLGVQGLKLTVLAGAGGAKQVAVGTVEYAHKAVAGTASVDALHGPVAHATATVGHGVFTGGVEGEYDTKGGALKKLNFAACYTDGNESEATVTFLNKGETGKVAYSHLARKDLTVAGEFLYDRKADAKLLTLGVKYEVDRQTTLKAKINSDGLVSGSYLQEIRPSTTLVLCQKFDVSNPDKSTHKFGLSLVIE